MGKTTVKDVGGTVYKNSIFGLLKCLKFPLHLKETEIGSDRNTLWIWFVKEDVELQSEDPYSKKRPGPISKE